jgi:hypothetical protein
MFPSLTLLKDNPSKGLSGLDRADLVHGFEGQKVKLTGVLDAKIKQIHVLKIELANSK